MLGLTKKSTRVTTQEDKDSSVAFCFWWYWRYIFQLTAPWIRFPCFVVKLLVFWDDITTFHMLPIVFHFTLHTTEWVWAHSFFLSFFLFFLEALCLEQRLEGPAAEPLWTKPERRIIRKRGGVHGCMDGVSLRGRLPTMFLEFGGPIGLADPWGLGHCVVEHISFWRATLGSPSPKGRSDCMV